MAGHTILHLSAEHHREEDPLGARIGAQKTTTLGLGHSFGHEQVCKLSQDLVKSLNALGHEQQRIGSNERRGPQCRLRTGLKSLVCPSTLTALRRTTLMRVFCLI